VDFQWRRALASDPKEETSNGERRRAVATTTKDVLAATVGTRTRKETMNTRRTENDSIE